MGKRILECILTIFPDKFGLELRRILTDISILIKWRKSNRNYHLSHLYCNLLFDKIGLEVAGPSFMFKTTIPIYKVVRRLDGINLSDETANTPKQIDGRYKYWLLKSGRFTVAHACDLSFVEDSTYDFVCSRAVLNYIGNPLQALTEWKRIIKPGGYILLTVAHYRYCYMHLMGLTSFEHLLSDYFNGTNDFGMEHYGDNIKYSSYKKSSLFANSEYLAKYINENMGKGGVTHHTFDVNLLRRVFSWLDMDLIDINIHLNDIVLLARKRLSPVNSSDIEFAG